MSAQALTNTKMNESPKVYELETQHEENINDC